MAKPVIAADFISDIDADIFGQSVVERVKEAAERGFAVQAMEYRVVSTGDDKKLAYSILIIREETRG